MRRLPLLLLASLMLAGCAPALEPATPPDSDPATVNIVQKDEFTIFGFAAGPLVAYDLRVEITGANLRLNAPAWCKPDADAVRCTVPELPAGKNFILPMTGSNITVVAKYKRALGGADFTRRIR